MQDDEAAILNKKARGAFLKSGAREKESIKEEGYWILTGKKRR